MLVVNIIITTMFIALGIAISKGKGINLIAGYNTMPAKEKEKIDEKLLCGYVSKLMFLLSACWVILSIGLEIKQMWLFWIGFVLFLVVTIFFVIYMNTGNRLEKKTESEERTI